MDTLDEKNVYKSNVQPSAFRSEIKSDLEKHMEKFSDPLVIGELLYKLLEERENTNRILKNILTKLERIETGTQNAKPETAGGVADLLLPHVDEEIMAFIKGKKHVTAQDVQKKFSYRGTNAASARLNRLYSMNLLEKKQVGKSVYFFLK